MTDRTHPDSGRATGGIVEALQARIADLEAQLASIGAGGVTGPLVGQPQAMPDLSQLTERGAVAWAGVDARGLREGFTAADMATAESRGFRDGVASLAASAVGEPGASRAFLERALSAMEGVIDVADRNTTEFDALRSCVVDLTLMLFKPQACHPSPPEGMVMVPRKASVAIICAIEGEVDSQLTASAMEPGLMHRQDGSDIWDAAIAAAPPTAQAEGWTKASAEGVEHG